MSGYREGGCWQLPATRRMAPHSLNSRSESLVAFWLPSGCISLGAEWYGAVVFVGLLRIRFWAAFSAAVDFLAAFSRHRTS